VPRRSSKPADDDGSESSTRAQILDAAVRCFARLGIQKTTLEDVASAAGMSRGTVYRYFADRDDLVETTIAVQTARYYDAAKAAMDRKDTLAAQVGAFAQATAQSMVDNQTQARVVAGDTGLMAVLVTGSERALETTMNIIRPYVQAAKDRREIRSSIDVDEATEFLARIVRSIATAPGSVAFDLNRPRTVGAFVERFAVEGLGAKR
jgi:AcrR family transcriptional regulator